MELEIDSYYLLAFTNGKEFYIKDSESSVSKFIKKVYSNDFIVLQRDTVEPVYIEKNKLFSTQKQNKDGTIGAQTRLWKLVLS